MAAKPKPKQTGFELTYGSMKQGFAKGGKPTKVERKATELIAERRGVSKAKAHAIGVNRTKKGLSTAGVAGPKGTPIFTRAKKAAARAERTAVGPSSRAPGEGTDPHSGHRSPDETLTPAQRRRRRRRNAAS